MYDTLCANKNLTRSGLKELITSARNGHHRHTHDNVLEQHDTRALVIYILRRHTIPILMDEENMGRKTSTTWLPVAHGGALASDFSSSRWKGVTASEDGRRDATINRGLTRRRRASSILSSAPSLRVLLPALSLSLPPGSSSFSSLPLLLLFLLFSLVTPGRPSP